MRRRSSTATRRRTGTQVAAAVATFGLLASVTGCGLTDGSDEESSGGDGGAVETSQLTVSALSSIDTAPLQMAVDNGYFEDEGLNVSIDQASDGQGAFNKMLDGDSEIALSSYVPFMTTQAEGAADLKFVADAVSTTPDSVRIVTTPDSRVHDVEDLEHKKIAVSARNTISEELVKAVMIGKGLDFSTVDFEAVPFPDIADEISRGDVDAGLLIEPFLTDAASSVGTVSVVDVAVGPAEDLPLTGYGALAEFTEENPNTLDAFSRALDRATDQAHDREEIEPVAAEMTGVDKDIATLMELPEFRTRLDATRIQRVANMLGEFEVLQAEIDVEDMIVQSDD